MSVFLVPCFLLPILCGLRKCHQEVSIFALNRWKGGRFLFHITIFWFRIPGMKQHKHGHWISVLFVSSGLIRCTCVGESLLILLGWSLFRIGYVHGKRFVWPVCGQLFACTLVCLWVWKAKLFLKEPFGYETMVLTWRREIWLRNWVLIERTIGNGDDCRCSFLFRGSFGLMLLKVWRQWIGE